MAARPPQSVLASLLVAVVGGGLAGGCAGPAAPATPATDGSGPVAARPADEPVIEAVPDAAARHTARTAAQIVSGLPPVTDEPTRRELLLHVVLYRAAHETNVGDFTRHFLLEPRPAGPVLAIDDAEFRLRILAGLADLGVPVAWSPPARAGGDAVDRFPGTRHLATRLGFRVLERQDGGRRVRGRISDHTPHVATSSQMVTAVWVGGGWTLERDPVRIVY